jgi:hypothetical protein
VRQGRGRGEPGEQRREPARVGEVREVVPDRPDDELRLRQPCGEPRPLGGVGGGGLERDVRRSGPAQRVEAGVAPGDDLVERPFEQVGLVASTSSRDGRSPSSSRCRVPAGTRSMPNVSRSAAQAPAKPSPASRGSSERNIAANGSMRSGASTATTPAAGWLAA